MQKIVSIGFVSLLVISGFLGIMNLTSEYASAYTTHNPIYINGNAEFTEQNGVTDGNGTKSNPYIIEGWDINASSNIGIKVRNTDAYFTIRNCYVHDGRDNRYYGIDFDNVQNGQIENTISSNNVYSICLDEYSSNNNVFNNSASNNEVGIYLGDYSSNNNVFNNSASNNICGIYLWNSSYNNISHNNASNNDCGIYLRRSSDNNNISHNNASNNGHSICLSSSNYNNISHNNASNNGHSICLSSSNYNNISHNSASNNEYCIYLKFYSSNNTFVFNNIFYNNCSVEIRDSYCDTNTFHHNNFINGSVVDVVDNGENTKWDDGHGEGNYWSNYTGLDNGSNGRVAGDDIGDTNIPHMGLDNYPLMEPVEQPYTPDTTPPLIPSVAWLVMILLIIIAIIIVIVVISRRKKGKGKEPTP